MIKLRLSKNKEYVLSFSIPNFTLFSIETYSSIDCKLYLITAECDGMPLKFSIFRIIVSSTTTPDFDWVKTVTVSDDMTVSFTGLECGTNIPRLMVDGWSKSVVDSKVDRYTKNGQTVVVNQTEEATGAVTGYFSLRYTDKAGKTVDIKGTCKQRIIRKMLYHLFFRIFINLLLLAIET